MTMQFEWDTEKEATNRKKHDGIAFSTAARVFDDPAVLLRKDRVVHGEQRWHAVGAVERALLLVVHVYREEHENDKEIIRIISARQANQRERRVYLQQARE
ncbi:MAG: BrnT family toxin [Candidatus Solibacter sp.]